jgi:hypothetical protein
MLFNSLNPGLYRQSVKVALYIFFEALAAIDTVTWIPVRAKGLLRRDLEAYRP